MDALRLAAVGVAVLLLAGCGGAPVAGQRARLRVIAEPPEARVYVDDRFIASARRLAVRPETLRVGLHHVTITAEGYFPHDVEVELPPGETKIEISLLPVPP